MTDDARIEAILFYRGEPVTRAEIARDAALSPHAVSAGLVALAARLAPSGLAVVEAGETVELRTAPDASALIEKLKREALSRDLGKAGAETLALILYRGPLSRSEIDYIRGVNSTFVLRNLLMRGLLTRNQNPKDQRGYIYEATTDLLSLLGVARASDLPEYESVRADIVAIEAVEVSKGEEPANAPGEHHE